MEVLRSYIWLVCTFVTVYGGAMKLDSSNFDQIIGNTDLVFINFYADWCRFSQMLAPTWDEAADKVNSLHTTQGKVVIGKVDCDNEGSISKRFHISKYPTLKLLQNGQVARKEYRGQRSVEAIAEFITDMLKDPVTKFESLEDIKKAEESNKKRIVIGYFDSEESVEYINLKKIALGLKDDCHFYAGIGDTVRVMHPPGQSIVVFKSTILDEDDAFTGKITSYDELSIWITERCVPLVREITFQNAEELTEEGLPFLILFHLPEDKESIQEYTKLIQAELLGEKQTVNFLTADGLQFAHPLHHLGKGKDDLPLIAIDSFRHMYLFPKYSDMAIPGKLKTFLSDLHSGKLHREFHYGPDPDSPEVNQIVDMSAHSAHSAVGKLKVITKKPTSPPESTFQKLAPSRNRYTLLDDKDEL